MGNFKMGNYWDKTPKLARKIGDSILLGSASMSALLMGAPISDATKTWVIFGVNTFGVLGKIISNFFKDEVADAPKP